MSNTDSVVGIEYHGIQKFEKNFNCDMKFKLSASVLSLFHKWSSLYLSDIIFKPLENNTLELKICDSRSSHSNNFKIFTKYSGENPFEGKFKIDNLLKLLNYSQESQFAYEVELCSRGVSRFKHLEIPLTYYISLEP